MSYYTNISNPELQYFHNLKVKNFTIKLTDVLTSGLFKVETIIADTIYKIYPLFYTKTILSSHNMDKILDNRCIICKKQENKETYLTFISDENADIQDYQSFAEYYDIDDNLSTEQFNAYVSLLRHNTVHNDSIRIAETVQAQYGTYEFDLDGCTILDNGIVITDETITAQPQVRLTGNVFHYSTYTLKLNILHYTGVNILDDITPTDFIVVDTLEIELTPDTWIPIPIANIENGYIIDFDTTVEIAHNKPVIADYIQTIEVTSEPTIIQTGETSEIYATGYDNGHVPVSTGHTIHFYEKIEPSISVSATPSIIQTGENSEIYAKVKDEDGSLAQNVQVHFYQQTEVPVPTTLSVVADNPVLSYSDGDKALLSATVRDQDSLPMSNQSVVFKVGDTVLDTVLTDGTGVAEYEYTSQGVGDVTFTVECMNLQETYELEDCFAYRETGSQAHNTGSTQHFYPLFDLTNIGDYEITGEISATTGKGFSVGFNKPTDWTDDNYARCMVDGAGYEGSYCKVNGNLQYANYPTQYTANTYFAFKFKYLNGVLTLTHKNRDWTPQVPLEPCTFGFGGWNSDKTINYRNLKIKPL